jgi:hypothetical protein
MIRPCAGVTMNLVVADGQSATNYLSCQAVCYHVTYDAA